MEFNPAKYGDVAARLIEPRRVAELGPGSSNKAARHLLKVLTPENLLAGRTLRDPQMAAACMAGMWLYHDYLDESHAMSQDLPTPSGSFWHAILHRREPDYANSKYWFRQVGQHPVYEPLHEAAAQLCGAAPDSAFGCVIGKAARWNPLTFVDLCQQAAAAGPEAVTLCREIQHREWELLFDYCFEHAVA